MRLGQPERGCGHDRPVLSRREQLQHERGTVHHLAPAVLVRAAADPAAPEVHGFLERIARVIGARAGRRLVRHHHLEDEPRRLVGAERELGHGGSVRELHRDGRAQPQHQLARAGAADEQDFRVAAPLDGVRRAGVVEARIAPHPETYLATDGLRATHEVVRDAGVLHRHEVRDLGHAAVRQEPGEQHIRVGQVQLPVHRVVELRRDLEAAAAIGVEESRKHRGGVKRREAEEVDRPVLAYQRDCVKVADDAVVLYGRVAVWEHRTITIRLHLRDNSRAPRLGRLHSQGIGRPSTSVSRSEQLKATCAPGPSAAFVRRDGSPRRDPQISRAPSAAALRALPS